jgi:hypothetical protein
MNHVLVEPSGWSVRLQLIALTTATAMEQGGGGEVCGLE